MMRTNSLKLTGFVGYLRTAFLGRLILSLAVIFGLGALWSAATGAHAGDSGRSPEAEKFVTDLTDQAFALLSQPNLSLEEKKTAFGNIVLGNADIRELGYRTLGPYKRIATPEQLARFSQLYEQYLRNFYESRLGEYSGQKIEIISSAKLARNHSSVKSRFIQADGSTLNVDWLVEKVGDTFLIRDLTIEGISLVREQNSQFTSIIQNNGGKIDVLLTKLEDIVARGESFDLPVQVQSN